MQLLNSAFVLNESRGLVWVDDDHFRRKHRENCSSSTTAASEMEDKRSLLDRSLCLHAFKTEDFHHVCRKTSHVHPLCS
jgi:hypothetical protein